MTLVISILWNQNSKLKERAVRNEQNVEFLESENYQLNLTKKQLTEFIDNSESEFAKEIDSICNVYDLKIKDLNQIIQAKTTTVIRDTTYLPGKIQYIDTSKKDKPIYHLTFLKENKCVSVNATAITTDSSTEIRFDKIETHNEAYSILHKKKKKWYQLFKKRKLELLTTNSCGTTTIKEIQIAK